MKFGPLTIRKVVNEKQICKDIFEQVCGYPLNLENPQSFNEKVNWYKFNYRDPLMTKCSAKDTVRYYVRKVFGKNVAKDLLVPLVQVDGKDAIFKKVSEIPWSKLPNQFVAKVNWGSGQNIIVNDKSTLDIEKTVEKLDVWMRSETNQYRYFFEWGYKHIKPRILIEEFLGDWGSVRDYKFFCFDGEPYMIYVSDEFDDHKEKIDMEFRFSNWTSTPYVRKTYKPPQIPFERPKSLDMMIEIARKLASPFPLVRIDLFEINGMPKVSEMTFYPSAGWGAFEEKEHDFEIGKHFSLSLKRHPARWIDIQWNGWRS